MRKLNIFFTIFIIFAIVVFTIVISSVMNSNKESEYNQEVTDEEIQITLDSIGLGIRTSKDISTDKNKIYRVNKQTMGTYTESDFKLMNQYAARKDINNFQGLYLDGKAIILNEGDQCKAIDIDFLKIKCECKTSKGNKIVWIGSESLD